MMNYVVLSKIFVAFDNKIYKNIWVLMANEPYATNGWYFLIETFNVDTSDFVRTSGYPNTSIAYYI